jgi:hypothetical protein
MYDMDIDYLAHKLISIQHKIDAATDEQERAVLEEHLYETYQELERLQRERTKEMKGNK